MSLDEPKGQIALTLNGDAITVPAQATARLSEVLRNSAGALDVKVGDKVLFGKYAGTEVKVDGEELLVMKEDDIMAVVA